MGLRSWLRKLERVSREELASFELLDGSLYFYDPATPELFMHWFACIGAGNPDSWPEPPDVVHKLTEAKDPRAALAEVMGGGDAYLTFEPEILINERRLEPRSLVADRDVHGQDVEDLSEP